MRARLNRPIWMAARAAVRLLLKAFIAAGRRMDVRNADRLPQLRRPLVIVSNHPSLLDTVFYSCAIAPRVAVCGAKPKYFASRVRRALMALGNVLPVYGREQYLRDCAQLLADGEVMLAYPEMGRNAHEIGLFSTWVAEVAILHHAPILPCHITYAAGNPRRAVITVGEEFLPVEPAEALASRMRSMVVALQLS